MCPLQAAQVHVLPEDAETERPCFICIILASPILTVGAPPDSRTTVGGTGGGWLAAPRGRVGEGTGCRPRSRAGGQDGAAILPNGPPFTRGKMKNTHVCGGPGHVSAQNGGMLSSGSQVIAQVAEAGGASVSPAMNHRLPLHTPGAGGRGFFILQVKQCSASISGAGS